MGFFSTFNTPTPVTESNGVTQAYSSFGIPGTTTGPDFQAGELWRGERYQTLEMRDQYYSARQHDGKVFNWEGRFVGSPKKMPTQPLIGGAEPSYYVPLNQRRPCAPYRLGRVIVDAFTAMVFGHGRWPTCKSDDPLTQDFAEALIKASSLQGKLTQARNIGGACGTVGLSWWFNDEGLPRVRVHHGRYLHVIEWEDSDELVPAHVVELTQCTRTEFDPKSKKRVSVPYWQRRDWTKDADIIFKLTRVKEKDPEVWEIDEQASHKHEDGFCHFVWVQNLADSDAETIDGAPDYDTLFEQMDELDSLNSVHVTGTRKNLDPTLVLNKDGDEFGEVAIRKGSDNALLVGEGGVAQYLTLGSDTVNAGKTSVDQQRAQVLESAQCVIPDPNQLTAAGTSAIALKLLYHPMLGKADLLRTQYGENCIKRLLNQMIESARRFMPDVSATTDEERYVYEIQLDEQGNQLFDESGEPAMTPVEYRLNLPPRTEKEERQDGEGNPTGEFFTRQVERSPGHGTIDLVWPDYFKATPSDRQAEASALVSANGGKPLLSQQTTVEQYANSLGLDGQEEFARVRDQMRAEREASGAMFPGIGGQVSSLEELPSDMPNETPALEAPTAEQPEALEQSAPTEEPGVVTPAPGGPSVELAPTTISKIMTANEARNLLGLGPAMMPDGATLDPDGNLPLDTYAAKQAANVAAQAEANVAPTQPPAV